MTHTRICSMVLFVAAIAGAQTKPPGRMAFASDSKAADTGGAVEILQAVCPGNVSAGKGVACKGACPESTTMAGTVEPEGWSVSAVTRGHFLSPTSDDAALAMGGCEPHASNWGGTVLLTRLNGRWTMRWYKAGVMTDTCHKVARDDGRELLVCSAGWTGQGEEIGNLLLTDLKADDPEQGFFRAEDSMATCGVDRDQPQPVVAANIEKVEFLSKRINGLPGISVTADYGKRTMKPSDWQACIDGKLARPATKTYQIEFQFDGKNYRPAQASQAAARVFEGQ
jgi:hypothetical protein